MKQVMQFIGAMAGALLAVFYLGSLASDTFIATRTFESSDTVMFQHSLVYLITIGASVMIGWAIGGILGAVLFKS